MALTPRLPLTVGCVSAIWARVASAEVMDKETPPWSPLRLLTTALVTGLCVVLTALSGRRSRGAWNRLVGLAAAALAITWAVAGTFDDFLSADVGPAMRQELGALAIWYALALFVASAAPVIVVGVIGRRSFLRRGRDGLPRERNVGPQD